MVEPGRQDAVHSGNWYVLVRGLPRPSGPVTLASGISVVPLPAPLDVFDLAALGSAGFREWGALEPMIRECTCEIESAKDASTQGGFDTMNRAWLAHVMLLLREFTGVSGVACSGYSWGTIPIPGLSASWERPVDPVTRRARTDLPPFKGGILDLHMRMFRLASREPTAFTELDTAWLSNYFAAADRLASASPQFHLALQTCSEWRFAKDMRSAIAQLWSGIEALFGMSSELVFRIALTGAGLLAPRGPDRRAKFQEIKSLYDLRSKAVHGSKLREEQMGQAVAGSFELLRQLLVLTIEQGHVLTHDDFDKAIFY